jgi:hypothetical protein
LEIGDYTKLVIIMGRRSPDGRNPNQIDNILIDVSPEQEVMLTTNLFAEKVGRDWQ